MRAYEFTTEITDGNIRIPIDYLNNLNRGRNVKVIILTEDETLPKQKSDEKEKLSDYLLMPEIEDNEDLFIRDKDTGREINL
ncbi:hypothetical protein GM3708_3593 (plasmid) [Geminocystis sp. NIES-3708]|uniref:hypothetical protein n=1 Tax=Geminocystis sp. NIES-3708 TaxID=1615909 RepID=UPI0005FC3A81|nr:hypothetical protein [Geminocystis sp. NIES-3708]BAQ63187.1 hypothetical protein GM3708_3593 [Geminocystis sp. NIES-3708]